MKNQNRHRRVVNCALETMEARVLMAVFGSTDTSFGAAGHVVTPIAGATFVQLREIQNVGGKILAGGDGALARYSASGALDSTFGTSGKVILPSVTFKALDVDSTGRVYVLTTNSAGTLLLRYTAGGKLDTSYASGGTALVASSASSFSPTALAIQSDGKVLVAGATPTNSGNGAKARVYRVKGDGSADTAWGTGGLVDVQLGTSNLLTPVLLDKVVGIEQLASGEVLLAGGSEALDPGGYDSGGDYHDPAYGDTMFAAARLSTGGALDSSYGSGGVARSTYATGVNTTFPTAFAAQTDGTCALAVNDRGFLKVGIFGAGGGVAFSGAAQSGYEFGTPLDMTVKSDGRFFILGVNTSRPHGLQLASVTAAGAFSNVTYTEDANATTVDIDTVSVGAITVASDGKLLVGGAPGDSTSGFELCKFDPGSAADARPDSFVNARANSIFQDIKGGIHVAYYDAAAKVLKYAYRAPSGIWSAPFTVDATPNAGQYVSISADVNGNPGIAYFEGTSGDFKFAYKSGPSWITERVETKGSVGLYPSLKFDNSGRPTAIYYYKSKGDLRFAVRNLTTKTWAFQNVQTTNDVGRSGDLEIAPSGHFACVYTDTTTGSVNYAEHLKGGAWSIQKAADTVHGADFLSLSFTYYGQQPAVAFYDANKADLKLTTHNTTGNGWTVRLLASTGRVGQYNKLLYDGTAARIYTYDRDNDRILLVSDSGAGTTVTPLVSGAGKYLSVFSDSSIADWAYYDASIGAIKVSGAPTGAEAG